MYQSQIRPSQITSLREKVEKKNYGNYLYKVNLSKVRNFENQEVVFDFPVTALMVRMAEEKRQFLELQLVHIVR